MKLEVIARLDRVAKDYPKAINIIEKIKKGVLHQDLNVLKGSRGSIFDMEDEAMEANIGRLVKYKNPDTKIEGQIALQNFLIGGIQRDYKGEMCYRIYAITNEEMGTVEDIFNNPDKLWEVNDSFGRPVKPERLEFIS